MQFEEFELEDKQTELGVGLAMVAAVIKPESPAPYINTFTLAFLSEIIN